LAPDLEVDVSPVRRRRIMSGMSSPGTRLRHLGDPSRPPGFVTTAVRRWWLVAPAAALVLAALCLRAPFSAVGPVLDELGQELSLSTGALAIVTALPLICFGLVSPFVPAVTARLGVHLAIVVGTGLLAGGIVLRLAGTAGLFAGTIVLTGGIALINVLLPAAARAEYGRRGAVVVGMTTAAMAVSAATGAGLAQPLTAAGGSARVGLLLWALPVLVALAAVAVLARARRGVPVPEATAPASRTAILRDRVALAVLVALAAVAVLARARRGVPVPEATAPASRTAILRDRVALAVTLYFGLQSLTFYAMLTWLPAILESEAGLSPVTAGALLAAAAILGAPASLVVPSLAARRRSQAGWTLAVALPTAVAIVGLLVAPGAAPVAWALLYGLGTGASFPLAMTMVLLRTRDVAQTGRLSASAQSIGYLIAAAGPLAVGLLHEATGGWTASLALLLAVIVVQAGVGSRAGRNRLVSSSA
jgi:CP family cyanate transporter-like MFS transporter